MSGNIYTLYKSHCENVGKYRGIEISGVVSSVEISKVESRATLLTLLDLVLHEHRKKFGTPYNQLNGKKALVHLILMKHHWMPKQINKMKFDELLLSIQDELTLDKISVASEHIALLQDAVDLEIATEEETSLLEAWKKYRVLLNRVDTSTAPDIEWPAIPVME
ncbi:ECs1072 family phage-associated protein [Escherichia coli]|uniref:ECs1072 family phage-associated protein n=1 Tax=Escherichia coli TaxID=562 RepID=UPI0023423F92|nr:tail fiber assembly protein [Escherichia coli]